MRIFWLLKKYVVKFVPYRVLVPGTVSKSIKFIKCCTFPESSLNTVYDKIVRNCIFHPDPGGQLMTVPMDPDQSRTGILETRILLVNLS